MIDYDKLVREYASQRRLDIVQPTTAVRNGWRYYYLNYSIRPRYLGHPHIIKISSKGEIKWVYDTDEIYWAYKQRVKDDEQSE